MHVVSRITRGVLRVFYLKYRFLAGKVSVRYTYLYRRCPLNPVEAVVHLVNVCRGNNIDNGSAVIRARDWKNVDWGAVCADLDSLGIARLSEPRTFGAW